MGKAAVPRAAAEALERAERDVLLIGHAAGRSVQLGTRRLHHPKEIGVPELLGRLRITVLELGYPNPDRRERVHGRTRPDKEDALLQGTTRRCPERRPKLTIAMAGDEVRPYDPKKDMSGNCRHLTSLILEVMIPARQVVCQPAGSDLHIIGISGFAVGLGYWNQLGVAVGLVPLSNQILARSLLHFQTPAIVRRGACFLAVGITYT